MKKNLTMVMIAAGLSATWMTGCTSANDTSTETTAIVLIEESEVPLYAKPAGSLVRTPQASGTSVHENGKVTLDVSNASQGYCMIK